MYDLLRDYVKQETLDPIRGAGRWMAWAALGAVSLILGVTFLMVGLLRLVQSELFNSNDGKTWIPYLIVVVVSLALVLSSKALIRKPSLHRKPRGHLMSSERITRDHVESRLKLVQDELQGKVNDKKAAITTGISIGAALIIVISYALGRRSGRRRRSSGRS